MTTTTTERAKKITRATIKKFIKDNAGSIWIRINGMTGCVEHIGGEFHLVRKFDHEVNVEHSLGLEGLWLVGDSRDYFQAFDNGTFKGFEISNCCGSQTIAIMKGGK